MSAETISLNDPADPSRCVLLACPLLPMLHAHPAWPVSSAAARDASTGDRSIYADN